MAENFNLNDARNGLYYSISDGVTGTLVNKPENWPNGEISVLSVHNNYGGFQFAIQTISSTMSFKKRMYSRHIGWLDWTEF